MLLRMFYYRGIYTCVALYKGTCVRENHIQNKWNHEVFSQKFPYVSSTHKKTQKFFFENKDEDVFFLFFNIKNDFNARK